MRRAARTSALAALLAVQGCDLPGPGPTARLTTMFDRVGAAQSYTLALANALSEGGQAAYYTTERWDDYPGVWVQPMYVLVTRWDDKNPKDNRLLKADGMTPAEPIFSVGAGSRFYSPYWRVWYVEVPEGTPAELTNARFRSHKDILDAHRPMHPGPGRICSFVPHERIPDSGVEKQRPAFGETVGKITHDATGWADGVKVWYTDFGADRFRWDADLLVQETPLFVLGVREAGGTRPAGTPNVGGSGPPGAGAPADAPGGRPTFGALWRVHAVTLPVDALGRPVPRVFIPAAAQWDPLRAAADAAVLPSAINPAIEARPDVASFVGKVAMRPTCFADPAKFPGDCAFLDSQAAVESLVAPSQIRRTTTLINCPMVFYRGLPVAP